jgi:hypothetical protein
MSMIIDEKTVGIWIVALPETGDWMAHIRELAPDEKYALVYRFRYTVDDKIFDSADQKHWYEGTLSGTRHYVVQSFRAVANQMASCARTQVHEVLMENRDTSAFLRRLESLPCIFARRGD